VTLEEGAIESVTPTAVVRRAFERLNDRDADAMLPFWSDDVAEVWPVVGRVDGKEAVRDYFAATFAAAPDFHIDVERMAAEGETV
jgi:limonene-1,2-epoxide hydrolase